MHVDSGARSMGVRLVGAGLVVVPVTPLIWLVASRPYTMVTHLALPTVAFAMGLLCQILFRRIRWPPPCARVLFWSALALSWANFWFEDLRFARAQVMLGIVPMAVLLGWGLPRLADAVRHRPKRRRVFDDVGVFLIVGTALLWSFFRLRSDNGCTGISPTYASTLLVTELLLFFFGPAVAAAHAAAAPDGWALDTPP